MNPTRLTEQPAPKPLYRRSGSSNLRKPPSQSVALGTMDRLGRTCQVVGLARVFGQVVQLVLAFWSKCGTSFHWACGSSASGRLDRGACHIVQTACRPRGDVLASQQRKETSSPDFEVRRGPRPDYFQDCWENSRFETTCAMVVPGATAPGQHARSGTRLRRRTYSAGDRSSPRLATRRCLCARAHVGRSCTRGRW